MCKAKLLDAALFKAAAKMSLGSATVPAIPPCEILTMPNTRLARFSSMYFEFFNKANAALVPAAANRFRRHLKSSG